MLDDEVVSIEMVPYEGSVYNFSVEEDETYVLEKIVTHNCLCFKTAELPDPDAFVDRLKSWMTGNPDPALDGYSTYIGGSAMMYQPMAGDIVDALEDWLWASEADLMARLG